MSTKNERFYIAHHTKEMIGRQLLLQHINDAIDSPKDLQVLYFYGPAGIGKTRLLSEIRTIQRERSDTGKDRFYWSGIVDLYHADMQSQFGVEFALAKGLDDAYPEDYFKEYFSAYKALKDKQNAGLAGININDFRQEVSSIFLRNYSRMARSRRIVLTFDTIELLQYERDQAQELFDIQMKETSLLEWFLEILPQLPRTVAIFAGRPDASWQQRLADIFQDDFYAYPIEKLTYEEAQDFLAKLIVNTNQQDQPLSEEIQKSVYDSSEGRPIYLSLLADFIYEGKLSLTELIPVANDEKKRPLTKIERMLVDKLTHSGPTQEPADFDEVIAIEFLAYAHRGLDSKLLTYLTEETWSDMRVENTIKSLTQYNFIKLRRLNGVDSIFFHDALYDLLDIYYVERHDESTFVKIRNYYQQLYDAIDDRLDDKLTYLERHELFRQQSEIMLTLLYYELQVDPQYAYYYRYLWWSEAATNTNNVELVMGLRSVLLRFIGRYTNRNSQTYNQWVAEQLDLSVVERYMALNWLDRYLIQNDLDAAYEKALALYESQHPHYIWDNKDVLYKAHLLLSWSRATSGSKVIENREKTLERLQQAKHLLDEYQSLDFRKNESKRRVYLLGLVYNFLGFFHRTGNRLTTARSYYKQAIQYFREIDVLDAMANTTNNLSFVYSRLGAIDEALALGEDALSIRQHLGQRFAESLSINTLGSIWAEDGHPIRAQALCKRAENIILNARLQNTYAYGLVNQTLGRVYRQMGNQIYKLIYDFDDASNYFELSHHHTTLAREYFAKGANTIRDFEVYIEFGRLYRDWMRFLRDHGNKDDKNLRLASQYEHFSYIYYDKAYDLAKELGMTDEIANVLQDAALLYERAGKLKKALEYVKKAEEQVPDEYKPVPNVGFTKIEEPIDKMWLILGDIYLTRTRIKNAELNETTSRYKDEAQLKKEILEMTENYVLAAACFETASPFPTGLRGMKEARKALYNHLKDSNRDFLDEVTQFIDMVLEKYQLGDFVHIRRYLNDTLGAY